MFKKAISIVLIFCLLVVSVPAASAETESTPSQSIEEILTEYHTKTFNALTAENGTAAAYSRSTNGDVTTLEQETVEQLTTAGYEAYNVTASNYTALEEELQTNFSDIGLDPNSSYIVVVSGSEENDSFPAGSRVAPPSYEDFDGGGSEVEEFTYTYEGTQYRMRYVTVTAATNTRLSQTNDAELLEGCTAQQKANALSSHITCLSLIPNFSTTTTILSLVLAAVPNAESTVPNSIDFRACSVWTPTYIQVYDSASEEWRYCTSFEYATRQYTIQYSFYNPSSNLYDTSTTSGSFPTMFSEYYYDRDYLKQVAAISFNNNTHPQDTIEELQYVYKDSTTQSERVVITHQRWSEYMGYEPA